MALVLLSSFASFSSLSVLSLFARDDVGASDTQVTLYFVVVALAGMAAMLVTGHLSDGRSRRVLIAASLAWLAVGYWALAATRTYAAMLAVGVVFFCAVGVPNAQLLAYASDLVQRRGDAASIAVIGLVRVVFSVGSFLGFASGGLGLAYLGARPVFRITGLLCLCCLALCWHVLRPAAPSTDAAPQPVAASEHEGAVDATSTTSGGRLLVMLAVVMVLFASGRVMQLAQLPILMRASLHAPLELIGFTLAVPPLCELVLMPAMAWAAVLWGRGRVFLAGAAASVVYYSGLVFVATAWQLLLLQVLYAVFGAATIMIGIDLAQRLMTQRAGMATSIYLGHENVAVVHGSIVATIAVAALGHQTGFLVPAMLCLIALTLAAGLFVRHPAAFDLRPQQPGKSGETMSSARGARDRVLCPLRWRRSGQGHSPLATPQEALATAAKEQPAATDRHMTVGRSTGDRTGVRQATHSVDGGQVATTSGVIAGVVGESGVEPVNDGCLCRR